MQQAKFTNCHLAKIFEKPKNTIKEHEFKQAEAKKD